MNTNIFYVDDNTIKLNTHKVTIRRYSISDDKTYTDSIHYVNAEGLNELEVNYVPKHKLLEIVAKEKLDTSDFKWMEGIKLRTTNRSKEIAEIASYGSLEAYQASLPEFTDNFMLDVECRLSMMELGLN